MALVNHNSAIRRAILQYSYVHDIKHMYINSTGTVPKNLYKALNIFIPFTNNDVMWFTPHEFLNGNITLHFLNEDFHICQSWICMINNHNHSLCDSTRIASKPVVFSEPVIQWLHQSCLIDPRNNCSVRFPWNSGWTSTTVVPTVMSHTQNSIMFIST